MALFIAVIAALVLVAVIGLSRGKAARRRDSAGGYLYTGFDGTTVDHHHHHNGNIAGGHHHGGHHGGFGGGHHGGDFSGGGHHG